MRTNPNVIRGEKADRPRLARRLARPAGPDFTALASYAAKANFEGHWPATGPSSIRLNTEPARHARCPRGRMVKRNGKREKEERGQSRVLEMAMTDSVIYARATIDG